MSKYGHRAINWFEAIVNKLGGEDAAERFLRGELVVSEPVQRWRKDADGVIRFTVVSSGFTPQQWAEHFKEKGIQIGDCASQLLFSPSFKTTNGVRYNVAVLPGAMFKDDNRVTQNIRNEAGNHKLTKPEMELACLIRDTFTDEEVRKMGLKWIITMHEAVKDSDGSPSQLGTVCDGGNPWLRAYYDNPGRCWLQDSGFAFLEQVSSSELCS